MFFSVRLSRGSGDKCPMPPIDLLVERLESDDSPDYHGCDKGKPNTNRRMPQKATVGRYPQVLAPNRNATTALPAPRDGGPIARCTAVRRSSPQGSEVGRNGAQNLQVTLAPVPSGHYPRRIHGLGGVVSGTADDVTAIDSGMSSTMVLVPDSRVTRPN